MRKPAKSLRANPYPDTGRAPRAPSGVPIKINSGFRCQALNKAVGGAANSYHTKGRAADIPMHPGWLAYIRDHLPHTELINEGTWIHVAL
ncbi:MAG: hypothetical protein IKP30_01460 [Bacteroidaceae bacterium]|nr:hypothetical protein [Bacteroidaceae bacterium]